MTSVLNEEEHSDKSSGERTRDVNASSSNANDGKLVQDIASAYRPSLAESVSAQLDHIRNEFKIPSDQGICTPENLLGISKNEAASLTAWDGRTHEPPKSVEQMQVEYERILAAPLAAVGAAVITEAFSTQILVYETVTRTLDLMGLNTSDTKK